VKRGVTLKHKDTWEVYFCPSVVPTSSTTLIHATEQLKTNSQLDYQATPQTKTLQLHVCMYSTIHIYITYTATCTYLALIIGWRS
jgi:hypothetical protein